MTESTDRDPSSHDATGGDDLDGLRSDIARYRHKLKRDRRYLEFSRLLIRAYRDGEAARRRGEAAFRLPDFYVIGAPRCGTTWLKSALSKHPDILMFRGEPAAFTRRLDQSPKEGLARYLPQPDSFVGSGSFEPARYDQLLIGEKSPDYMTMGPSRLQFFLELNPNARFIQLCREPSERLWSHFLHKFSGQPAQIDAMHAAASVEESRQICPEGWRLIDWAEKFGRYRQNIGSWRTLVPGDRLLELSFHDLVDAPGAFLREILSFIGADPDRFDDARLPPPQSATASVAPPSYLLAWMRDLYGDEPDYVASLSRRNR